MPNASERWEARNETEQPSNGRSMRGLLLKSALSIAATLSSGTAYSQSTEQPRSVNEFAQSFPKASELESIDDIRLDLRENARHLLIHLRIIHWHDNHVDPGDIRKVRICQTQWKNGLQSMIDHPGIRLNTVYAEGKYAMGTPRLYSRPLDVQSIVAARSPEREEGITLTSTQPSVSPFRDEHPILISQGADYHLYNEGKIQLWGPEWEDAKELSCEAQKENWPDKHTYIFDLRERAALEIIAADRMHIAYVFYGAAHDWSDNITDWNEEHPDEAFSLMEISPDCLIDDETGDEVLFEDPRYKLPPPPISHNNQHEGH